MPNPYVRQLVLYASISVLSYIVTFTSIFALVDLAGAHEQLAYMLTYLFVYLMDYTSSAYLVFRSGHNSTVLMKYVVYQIALYILSSTTFYLLSVFDQYHYLVRTAVTILVFMPVKFFVQKKIVFITSKLPSSAREG